MPSIRSAVVRHSLVTILKRLRMARSGRGAPPTIDQVPEIRGLIEKAASSQRLPSNVTIEPTAFGPVGSAQVPGEWVRSSRSDGDRVVLYLHGGAFVLCSPRTHRGITSTISIAARAHVAVPQYRLAPEHAYPAAVEDAQTAYEHLLDSGLAPERIAVAGDSAGGGLTMQLLLKLREEGRPLPACAVLLSPWVDLSGSGQSMTERADLDPWLDGALMHLPAEAYAGDLPTDDPRVSPLFADLQGLPPMLVHVGTDEIIHDDATRLVDRARAAGVDADLGVFHGLWHVFHAFPGIPERRSAMREVGGYVRRHIPDDPGLAPRAVA